MIGGKTKLQLLDLKSGDPIIDTVENIFQKYSHLIEQTMDGKIIKFKDVKITDWTGWTDLFYIYKVDPDDRVDDWLTLTTDSGNSLDIGNHPYHPTWIMIYDPDKSRRGFHGEILYHFELYGPLEIYSGLIGDINGKHVRVRGLSNDDGRSIQFCKCLDIDKFIYFILIYKMMICY